MQAQQTLTATAVSVEAIAIVRTGVLVSVQETLRATAWWGAHAVLATWDRIHAVEGDVWTHARGHLSPR